MSANKAEMVALRPVECCQQLCMANGNGDHGVRPVDVPVESETLKTMSIQLEEPNSGGIPCVHLGGTCWHAGDANKPGCRTDVLRGQMKMLKDQADVLRWWMDTLDVFNRAEMAGISHGEGARMYLGVGDTKQAVNMMDGIKWLQKPCGHIKQAQRHAKHSDRCINN